MCWTVRNIYSNKKLKAGHNRLAFFICVNLIKILHLLLFTIDEYADIIVLYLNKVSVGANCVRPSTGMNYPHGRTQFAPTGANKKFIYILYSITTFYLCFKYKPTYYSPSPIGDADAVDLRFAAVAIVLQTT